MIMRGQIRRLAVIASLLFAVSALLFGACTAMAEDGSGEDAPSVIRSVTCAPAEVKRGETVRCTVALDKVYAEIDMMIYFDRKGSKDGGSMRKKEGNTDEISFDIPTTDLDPGDYVISKVELGGQAVSALPELPSFTVAESDVRGLDVVPGSGRISKKYVLPGEAFTVSQSFVDSASFTEASVSCTEISAAGVKTEKVIKKYVEKLSEGDVHELTFTIPTSGSVGTTYELFTVEVKNTRGSTASSKILESTEVVIEYPASSDTDETEGSSKTDQTDSGSGNGSKEDSGDGDSDNKSSDTATPAQQADDGKPKAFSAGTALSPMTKASRAAAYLVKKVRSDDPLLGTEFGKLKLRQSAVTSSSVSLVWDTLPKAEKYIVFGNACGKKFRRLGEVGSARRGKWTAKNLSPGTYYKYIVMAVDEYGRVLSTSTSAVIATGGTEYGNPKSVTVGLKARTTIKTGAAKKLGAKRKLPAGKKVRSFGFDLRFEWSHTDVLRVNEEGMIKGQKKGTAMVYAFAQNGLYKAIEVTVK